MKKKSLITMLAAMCLVFALGAGATMAYLVTNTKDVTNTFTVGKNLQDDDILLDEAPVNPDTHVVVEGNRVNANTYNNLQIGDQLPKDPQVHIAADTADCYVFVQVNNADALAAYGIVIDGGIASDWVPVAVEDGKTDGIYLYKGAGTDANGIFATKTADTDLTKVFEKVLVEEVDGVAKIFDQNGNAVDLSNTQLVVKACAVQAANVDAEEALTLAQGVFNPAP